MLASCGTEEYVYLYAPSEYNSPSSTSLTRNMLHNTNNEGSIFQGYQLYYKIYGCTSPTEAPALAATEASAIESSSSSPDVVYTKLTSTYGYKPVLAFQTSGKRISTPIVKIASTDTGHSIYASFEFDSGSASIEDTTASSIESFLIRRSVSDSDSSSTTGYKEFSDLRTAAADTDDVVTTNGSAHYWIRIYALAYGLNSTTWTNVYSSPAVLANTIYLGANGSK
jgi:hypothetical protein